MKVLVWSTWAVRFDWCADPMARQLLALWPRERNAHSAPAHGFVRPTLVFPVTEKSLPRREFIKYLGRTTLGVSFALTLPASRGAAQGGQKDRGSVARVFSWVVIHADNSVTVRVPQTELGQGVSTTIPQIIADELALDWARVQFEFYDPAQNATQNNVFVWTTAVSSSSAHMLFTPARQAAAQMRTMLIDAATRRLAVASNELRAQENEVVHQASGRKLSYAELVNDPAELQTPDPERVVLRDETQRQLIGKPLPRLDVGAVVQGAKQFGIDLLLPGMRYAAIRQSPVYGASLISFDSAAIEHRPGHPRAHRVNAARVGYNSPVPEGEDADLWAAPVNIDDAVAVVADTWWQAEAAIKSLDIKWSESNHREFSSDAFTDTLHTRVAGSLPVVAEHGDVDSALASAAHRVRAVYTYPYMEPAPLEPMNCTALVDDSGVQVWTNSQFPDDVWRIAYELAGVEPRQARVHLLPAGGGFGRRLHNDVVHQAIQIAQQNPGTPIKLLWGREESTRKSFYAPLTVASFDGGIDAT